MTEMEVDIWTVGNYTLPFVVTNFLYILTPELYAYARMAPPPQYTIADFFRKFDNDKNGLISYNEFQAFVFKFNGF
jgi:hypothetical protein